MMVAQYFTMCENFNWDYKYSQDKYVFSEGLKKLDKIQRIADPDPVLKRIYEAWKNYAYSGDRYNTPQEHKPELSDFM